MAGKTTPKIILGTMTFALESTPSSTTTVRVRGAENSAPFFKLFRDHGHDELDTARLYCHGDTETVMGELDLKDFKIATKVWPMAPNAHSFENLKKTFRESLAALKTQKVDIFYLHAPDYTTPFEETIQAVDELYREGHFDKYNVITRDVVRELLPCLKALGIVFYAYNPIAGGLLSGKYNFESTEDGSRFDVKTGFGKIYRRRYWNDLFFESIKKMETTVKEHSLTLVESALRWITHHSGLGPNDGIVIGASSLDHLESNLNDLEKGPLPQEVVDAFDEAWEHVRVACPPYFKDVESAIFISSASQKDE
ncbi:Aldo/keto reductase [Mortierella sp. GBAus27b]|nr:hypothetical protein BGX31_010777 [Mortierella sp. GBA43]KAI8345914.1 Aldo/keto reductase [Mortierella sp. GBAus27b]